jgi:hypothetical protein
LPLRNRCGCNESVIKVWLSLPAPAHRPSGPMAARRRSRRCAWPPRENPRRRGGGCHGCDRGEDPPRGPIAVARNGENTQPTEGTLSGLSRHEARRAALSHAGAEPGMHHLDSQDTRRSLSCRRPKSHPVERQARRSHSLARPARGPSGPAAIERGSIQQDAVDRIADRQRQDLGSGAPIRART